MLVFDELVLVPSGTNWTNAWKSISCTHMYHPEDDTSGPLPCMNLQIFSYPLKVNLLYHVQNSEWSQLF